MSTTSDSIVDAANETAQAAEDAAVTHEPSRHAAPPVIDVLDDVHEPALTEEEDHAAPPPPTGDSFGVATPVHPPGLSRKMQLTVVAIGAVAFFLLIFGVFYGLANKMGEAHRPLGDRTSTSKRVFGTPGGGLVAPEALGTPAPNGTPVPYSPFRPQPQRQQQQYQTGTRQQPSGTATAVPGKVVLSNGGPVCQVQPGYAGPPQPGCPVQQGTVNGTQQQYGAGAGGGGTYVPPATPSPAQIAAEKARADRIASLQAAVEATPFVADTQAQSPGGTQTTGSQFGATGQQLTAQQIAALAQQYAQQQQQYGQRGYAGATPAPTPPPPNYLNVGVGTAIPVSLKTFVDCTVPGGVTAQVNEPGIFDSTGTYLLAPSLKSSVIGETVNVSNGHCDIVWTTLRLPNGSEMPLASFHSQDARGENGIGGTVDDHRWNIARTGLYAAGLAGTIGYVLTKAQMPPQSQGGIVVVTQSPNQQAITDAISPIQGAMQRIINLDANRTVQVGLRAGTHLNLYVNSPLYLPPWQQ